MFSWSPEIIACNATKRPQGGEKQSSITYLSSDIKVNVKPYSIPTGFLF